jgi:hypothetical protein
MLDPQFFPWCDSASPTSPLPWWELQPRLPLPWWEGLGEGEKYPPGSVKLWESPGRAGGLPMINYILAGRFSEPKSCRANGVRMMGFSKKRFSMSRFSPDTAVADADEVCL